MKYCKNCGTLLEDSHEVCIGCGADVSDPSSCSLYPPDIAESIEKDKQEVKTRGSLIAALIIVFVLLVAAIAVFIIFNAKNMESQPAASAQPEVAEEVSEPEEAEEIVAEEETAEAEEEDDGMIGALVLSDAEGDTSSSSDSSDNRTVKDSNGIYLVPGSVNDDAGNLMFSTLYPEDFEVLKEGINYGIYSTKFPESLSYIVGNKDGNVHFTYMSPQHYWYRKSDGKNTMKDERNSRTYMQYLTYNGAQGYIEAIIKQSYTDVKGVKFISKEEASSEHIAAIEKTAGDHTMELAGEVGDYAKIAKDCVYVAMAAESEADIYHYEITSRQGNIIYLDFYCPVIANTLGYVTTDYDDKGEVTEWTLPEVVVYEAGNEELYNLYKDAFNIFLANAKLSDEFYYVNSAYSEDVEKRIAVEDTPDPLDSTLLSKYHKSFKPDAKLPAFTEGIKNYNSTYPASYTVFSGDKGLVAPGDYKVGFYSSEKNKVFISKAEDEYPGSEYKDLDSQTGSSETSSEDSGSEGSSDSE